MIENEYIESINKLENGHILLVVKEESRVKLSSFAFEDNIKYADPYYNAKGWLELFDIDSVKIFISANKRHLSEELSKSILEDAEKLTFDQGSINFASRKLNLFAKTNEKISLEKLQALKYWAENFLNGTNFADFLPYVFSNIFRVILPSEKRETIDGIPFITRDMEKNGNILIQELYDQIGQSYKKYYDFVLVCGTLLNWDNLGKVAQQPEVLGNKWDLLNEDNENHVKALSDWLQYVIASRKNPIDESDLSELDIRKLEVASDCLLRAYEMLNPDMKRSYELN